MQVMTSKQPAKWWETMLPPDVRGAMGMGIQEMANGVFTGLGPDNRLQPDNPTMMANVGGRPGILHEGEVRTNGGSVIPANQVQAMGGPRMVDAAMQQQQLRRMQGAGMPGYQAGFYDPQDAVPAAMRIKALQDEAAQMNLPIPSTPGAITGQSLTFRTRDTPAPAAATGPSGPAGPGPISGIGQLPGVAQVTGASAPVAAPAAVVREPPSSARYQPMFQQGLTGLSQIAQGASPYMRTVANRALGSQAAQSQAGTAGLQQQMAQMGITGSGGAETAAMLGRARDVGAAQGQLQGQLAESAQQQMQQATANLATAAMSGMRFDEDKRQFDENLTFLKDQHQDKEGWNQYDRLIAAGDYTGAAKQMTRLTGVAMDPTRLEEQYKWKQEQFGWDRADRLLKQADTLLTAGGTANIAQAADLFKKATGLTLDTSRIQTADQWKAINAATSNVVTNLSEGFDSGNVQQGLKDLWTAQGKTGDMDEAWAKDTYQKLLRSEDPLYRNVNAISDDSISSALRGLGVEATPEKIKNYRDTLYAAFMTGAMKLNEDGIPVPDPELLADLLPKSDAETIGTDVDLKGFTFGKYTFPDGQSLQTVEKDGKKYALTDGKVFEMTVGGALGLPKFAEVGTYDPTTQTMHLNPTTSATTGGTTTPTESRSADDWGIMASGTSTEQKELTDAMKTGDTNAIKGYYDTYRWSNILTMDKDARTKMLEWAEKNGEVRTPSQYDRAGTNQLSREQGSIVKIGNDYYIVGKAETNRSRTETIINLTSATSGKPVSISARDDRYYTQGPDGVLVSDTTNL